MTERVLGTSGKERRRRLALIAPLALIAVVSVVLIAAAAAPALNTDAATYSIAEDQDGRNDEPGQKDLTLQGTNSSNLPTAINVLWNWDETSVGGGNTLDGCTLFDTDGDGNANFAFCAIAGNVSNTNKTLELKNEVLYTCGDTRNDRCSSQIAIVSQSSGTECQLVLNSNTNPFGDNPDTRIFCTVVLADVGATTAVLLNTCSYPSQQPNSDPSDCVLIPGKANPTISTTPTLEPQDSATVSSNTNGSVTFELYKDTDLEGDCDAGELVFSQTDTSSPFATSNTTYTITSDGTYLWKVNYSGDADNNAAESACGVEKYVIDVTPNPS
jgi:hypothetical protein